VFLLLFTFVFRFTFVLLFVLRFVFELLLRFTLLAAEARGAELPPWFPPPRSAAGSATALSVKTSDEAKICRVKFFM
jgi:hypothetical protein